MKGISRMYFVIATTIVIVASSIFFVVYFQDRLLRSAQFHESATTLHAIGSTQVETAGLVDEVDIDGVHFGVIQKEFQVKEGGIIMNECVLSIVNLGPGDVDMYKVPVTWELGDPPYYSGTGFVELGTMHEGQVRFVSCLEVFQDLPEIVIETDKFLIDKIPLTVTMSPETGETWDNWEVTYISKKGMT